MLPLLLAGVGLLLAASAGGGGSTSATKAPGAPGSGTITKGPPPPARVALKLGVPPDPLLSSAMKARAYVEANPSKASELDSLAKLARSRNRPDIAAILSSGASGAAPQPHPVIHLAGL